jgi:hypothetical protein
MFKNRAKSGKRMAKTWNGPDRSLEVSLREYGIAWQEKGDDFLFYYGIKREYNRAEHCNDYTRFDWGYIRKDTDVRKEYNWVDWKDFFVYNGNNAEDWDKLPLPYKIVDLVDYYGYENILGTSYSEGFRIKF